MDGSWVDFRTIKQSVTMQMVLDHYGVKLRRNGSELRGRCPIHKGEGTNTFHVNTEKQVFNCFSGACKAKGNVLDFVAAMEHSTIREAAQKIGEWYSIPAAGPPARSEPQTSELATKKDHGIEATDRDKNKPLTFRLGGIDPAHPYLQERGIEKDTAEFFGAGFFPGKGSMHERVVIPIENELGELVAYVGRSIDESEPKYRLPPGFKKSQVVFNLLRARDDSDGTVVLVEGFFDCMKITQAEYPCVALMGCSMSADQQGILASNFNRIIVMLDGDDAGRTAVAEIAGRLAWHSFVRVADVGDGKQPDQLSKEGIQKILAGLR